jgi:hypothetical protein
MSDIWPAQSPRPPENVRIKHWNGTVIPLELVYVGIEDGEYLWEVVNPPELEPGTGWVVSVGLLPEKTRIRV